MVGEKSECGNREGASVIKKPYFATLDRGMKKIDEDRANKEKNRKFDGNKKAELRNELISTISAY